MTDYIVLCHDKDRVMKLTGVLLNEITSIDGSYYCDIRQRGNSMWFKIKTVETGKRVRIRLIPFDSAPEYTRATVISADEVEKHLKETEDIPNAQS